MHFVDPTLLASAVSFENDRGRFELATQRAAVLRGRNIEVEVVRGDILKYERRREEPHMFFMDFPGICAWSDYESRFADMFQNSTLREDDALFITSHVGRNPGWKKVFETFEGEFGILGAAKPEEKRLWYRRAHPSFTLFRALRKADLADELSLKCLGCIEYRDVSPMAVYGYAILPGKTGFAEFVKDDAAPHFKIGAGYMRSP
jgi:hypothetical protein